MAVFPKQQLNATSLLQLMLFDRGAAIDSKKG
jgi:hypothetical protein